MKNLRIIIAVLFTSTLVLTSCEDENITPSKSRTETVEKSKSLKEKDGGGDEEDWIIIYGVVVESNSTVPISNSEVVLFDANQVNAIDTVITGSQGSFEFLIQEGRHSFIVNAEGYQELQSVNYDLPDSSPLTFELELD